MLEVEILPRSCHNLQMAHIRPAALAKARTLRRNETPAEHRLWMALRGRRLQGHKFIRQSPVGPYIVDFLCRENGLVIELDGATHSTDEELAYDTRRTAFLNAQGLRVLRLLNDDVYRQFDNALEAVLIALQQKA